MVAQSIASSAAGICFVNFLLHVPDNLDLKHSNTCWTKLDLGPSWCYTYHPDIVSLNNSGSYWMMTKYRSSCYFWQIWLEWHTSNVIDSSCSMLNYDNFLYIFLYDVWHLFAVAWLYGCFFLVKDEWKCVKLSVVLWVLYGGWWCGCSLRTSSRMRKITINIDLTGLFPPSPPAFWLVIVPGVDICSYCCCVLLYFHKFCYLCVSCYSVWPYKMTCNVSTQLGCCVS